MNQRNCPNCGAPYDITLNKCPYCGTSYFDLTAIDIYKNKPFYLKLKAGNMIFTSKVIVKPDVSISVAQDSVDAFNVNGNIISKINLNKFVDIDLGFTSIPDYKNNNVEMSTLEYSKEME